MFVENKKKQENQLLYVWHTPTATRTHGLTAAVHKSPSYTHTQKPHVFKHRHKFQMRGQTTENSVTKNIIVTVLAIKIKDSQAKCGDMYVALPRQKHSLRG
jgi:hypothetical protein